MAESPEIAHRSADGAHRSAEVIQFPFPPPSADSAPKARKAPEIVAFDRRELSLLLSIYGRKVAAGEWRDYALDMLRDRAYFSIFRRTSERPQYVIEKNPRLRNRQGQFTVTNAEGRILRRGHELDMVLRVFDYGLTIVK
ncbi:MAG: DUF2794 domain-containing protein [Alphaproteobacteria bacterium]|nr:DUF2794 domain-containing protein [Alphaproteobacteria bacterium]